MDGRDELRVKELYYSIKELTTYQSSKKDCQKHLEQLIKESVIEKGKANAKNSKNAEFDTNKDKDFTAAIFSIDNKEPNDRYVKYDLLDEFYTNSDQYKEYSKSIAKGAKQVSDEPKPKSEGGFAAFGLKKSDVTPSVGPGAKGIEQFTIGNQKADEGGFSDEAEDNEEDKEDAEHKPNKFASVFGKKTASGGLAPIAKDEKDLISKLREIDFTQLKGASEPKSPDGRRQSMRVSSEEIKEFNKLISGFIKDFKKIADKKVATSALKVMRSFMFEHNGSKQFQTARERSGQANYDVAQFWSGTNTLLKGLNFGTELEKYVWTFVELEVESFTVSTAALEKLIQTTTKKNLDYRADEIIKKLNIVYQEIIARSTNDPDKSVEIEYDAKIKDGVHINKGSVEELIHNIKNFNSDPKNKAEFLKAFSKFEDGSGEIDIRGLKQVLDEVKINNTQKQREHIFKLIDTDKNVVISKAEFTKYLDDYNEKLPLSSNILANSKGANKLGIFKEIMEVKIALNDNDYFLKKECGYESILNSDYAALTRCEQLLSGLAPGQKFFDVDFGPKNKDDEKGSKMSLYATGEAPPGYIKPEQIEWLMPTEMLGNDKYSFTSEETSSNEVIQGALGDCWFIGALSVLASRDELIIGGLDQYKTLKDVDITPSIATSMTSGVYPPIFHPYAKKGLYVFTFFKNFKWRYVIIDERIPCYKSNKTPCFGRCKNLDELWVPLIEKAYAKLHCCYEALVSGYIDDALSDLTGFVAEKLILHDRNGNFPNKKVGTKEYLWQYLSDRVNESSLLG